MSRQCSPGKAIRKGYKKKGYYRKAYVKRNGTLVPAAKVNAANVPAACITYRGHHKKPILPKLDNKLHLSPYGYSIHHSTQERRDALRNAAADYDLLVVLRRLNLARNYQATAHAKEIMTSDVDYLKKLYANQKKKHGPSRRSYDQRQRGGYYDDDVYDEDVDARIRFKMDNEHHYPTNEEIEAVDDEDFRDAREGLRNKWFDEHMEGGRMVYRVRGDANWNNRFAKPRREVVYS